MNKYQKYSLFGLRIAFGSLFLYAGLSKVMSPDWSAAGYLNNAASFSSFFSWLASPGILPLVNFLNEWGQVLLGVSLLLGILVRLSAPLGAGMMVLYYLALDFPFPSEHAFLVDEHVIYAVALLVLAAHRAGRIHGLDAKIKTKFS